MFCVFWGGGWLACGGGGGGWKGDGRGEGIAWGRDSGPRMSGVCEEGGWTYFVAIPEHLANVFRATRSPRRILRMGPRTVAQCLTGSKDSPSRICHATLYVYLQRSGNYGDPRRKEANVRVLGEEGGEETHTCNPTAGRLRRKREHRPPCPRCQKPEVRSR